MTPQMAAQLIDPVKAVVTDNWTAFAGVFALFFGIKLLPKLIRQFTS